MKALYRRYRPMTLGEVIGQSQVTEPLIKSLEQGKVNHAYLFIGPRGTGKTSVARIFAHEVNGFKYTLEDDYVDIIEIDGASNRGIDNIRELREKVAIMPTSGKYKIYIIDEVHMLTKEAFNALLKTLEEPPAHVIFIMATTDAYKVPVTITSRAQTFTFKLADFKTMFDFLKSVCKKEKIKIDDNAIEIIVKRGGGSFRDSLSLLDQISTLSDEKITKEMVILAMGLPEDEKIAKLLDDYTNSDLNTLSNDLKELLNSGVKAETLVEEMISHIIDSPQPELIPLLSKLAEIKAPFAEVKLLVALSEQSLVASSQPKQGLAHDFSGDGSLRPVVTGEAPSFSVVTSESPRKICAQPSFDWGKFCEVVKGMNDAIYIQLKFTTHEVNGEILNIYPTKKMSRTILSRDNNKRILAEAAGGMKIIVHDLDEKPKSAKDALISKMSDIMGGEVQNDGGGNPF